VSDATDAFDALAARFEGALERGRMMGRPTLQLGRRMVACLDGDVLGIRLDRAGPDLERALTLPGTGLFAPGSGTRRFRDWAGLPVELADAWDEYVAASVALLQRAGRS